MSNPTTAGDRLALSWHEAHERLSAVLRRVTYKPGWKFSTGRRDDVPDFAVDRCYVRYLIETQMFDSRRRDADGPSVSPPTRATYDPTASTFGSAMPAYGRGPEKFSFALQMSTTVLNQQDESHIIRAIHHDLLLIETHELDEWLRVDAVLVSDPHAGGRNML